LHYTVVHKLKNKMTKWRYSQCRNTILVLLLLLHHAFRWFSYFHTPTYALVSYTIKLALIIYIKTLYSLTAPTCFDTHAATSTHIYINILHF
jgi:hypothetical protein